MSRVILAGRGRAATVYSRQKLRKKKQNENASLIKVPSHVANTDKNYGLM